MRCAAVIPLASAIVAGTAVYYLADPSTSRWMPQCIIHRLTGYQCPGCGSQRMLHALLHGDIASAWSYNAFLLMMLPLIAVMVWLEITRKKHPEAYRRIHSLWTVGAICTGIALWTVYRNLA